MITKSQILDVQNKWGNGIVKIGALKDSPKICFKLDNPGPPLSPLW